MISCRLQPNLVALTKQEPVEETPNIRLQHEVPQSPEAAAQFESFKQNIYKWEKWKKFKFCAVLLSQQFQSNVKSDWFVRYCEYIAQSSRDVIA